MECRVCNKSMKEICGEFVCGFCYERKILTEKLVARDGDVRFINVPNPVGHNNMVMVAERVR
jgi:hypothetical protein